MTAMTASTLTRSTRCALPPADGNAWPRAGSYVYAEDIRREESLAATVVGYNPPGTVGALAEWSVTLTLMTPGRRPRPVGTKTFPLADVSVHALGGGDIGMALFF